MQSLQSFNFTSWSIPCKVRTLTWTVGHMTDIFTTVLSSSVLSLFGHFCALPCRPKVVKIVKQIYNVHVSTQL